MAPAAPRVPRRLLAEIERLAIRDLSFAETTRRVGRAAADLGLPRPCYETVRVLVRAAREVPAGAGTLEIAAGIGVRVRLHRELLDRAARLPVRPLSRARK